MQVVLYRGLRTTPEHRARMAAYWTGWERQRREFDTMMDTARDALCSIPARLDLPEALTARVSDVASGVCMAGPVAVRLQMGGGKGGAAGGPDGDIGTALLLGGCPEATAAPREAHEVPWAVHVAEAGHYAEMMDVQFQPMLLMAPEQVARLFAGHLTLETAPVDFMALCQLAKTQHHRDEILRTLPV
eukprot:jgi/Ulvmu1/1192/UM108_0020.1